MAYAHAARYHCFLDVARHVVVGLPRVVALPQPNPRVPAQHLLNNPVILLQTPVEVFFLEEVNPHCLLPIQLANLGHGFGNVLLGEGFPDAEDEPY